MLALWGGMTLPTIPQELQRQQWCRGNCRRGPNIPWGEIYIEDLLASVNDRGGAIGPNDIDLAVKSREEAIRFGQQQRLVILKLP